MNATSVFASIVVTVLGNSAFPGDFDVSWLTDLLASRAESLESILVEYIEVPRAGSSSIDGGYSRRLLAAKGPSHYMRDNGHGHASMHWDDDPFRKILWIDGRYASLYSTLNRIVESYDLPNGLTPIEASSEILFQALCWWPFSDWAPPQCNEMDWSMRALMSSGSYHVRFGNHEINGAPCVVIESRGKDVIWVEREFPNRILRREILNAATGELAASYDYAKYKQFSGDIWLPTSIKSVQYDAYGANAELRRRKVVDTQFLLDYQHVNDVPAAFFQPNYLAGSVRRTVDEGKSHYRLLESGEIAFAAEIVRWMHRSARQDRIRPGASLRPMFWRFALGFAISLLLLQFWLGWNRRTAKDSR